MPNPLTAGLLLAALMATPALAETIEVRMLNKGADGERMVFEPDAVTVAPGDTIKFIAADRGHNAESIDAMMPDGAEAFAGRINEEIEVTLTEAGLYAIQCKPHYAMGMVMIVSVGDADVPGDFLAGRIPPKAKSRLEAQLAELAAD